MGHDLCVTRTYPSCPKTTTRVGDRVLHMGTNVIRIRLAKTPYKGLLKTKKAVIGLVLRENTPTHIDTFSRTRVFLHKAI
jgi:hypothetical protein